MRPWQCSGQWFEVSCKMSCDVTHCINRGVHPCVWFSPLWRVSSRIHLSNGSEEPARGPAVLSWSPKAHTPDFVLWPRGKWTLHSSWCCQWMPRLSQGQISGWGWFRVVPAFKGKALETWSKPRVNKLPGLPRTVLVLALRVPCPRKAPSPVQAGMVGHPILVLSLHSQ